MSRPPIRLHRHALSGHCHRVEALLALLELPYVTVDVDLAGGEHRRAPFLALNPAGQVPVIEDDGVVVADSNAILVYLARRYGAGRWLPEDAVGAARVQRWLSAAAGPVAFGVARARLVTVFGAPYVAADAIALGHAFLTGMDAALAGEPFLAGAHPTIADLACVGYVAHAPEGNVSLAPYPNVRGWIERVEALPRFVKMDRSAAGLIAA